jgi:hypothetical protein
MVWPQVTAAAAVLTASAAANAMFGKLNILDITLPRRAIRADSPDRCRSIFFLTPQKGARYCGNGWMRSTARPIRLICMDPR